MGCLCQHLTRRPAVLSDVSFSVPRKGMMDWYIDWFLVCPLAPYPEPPYRRLRTRAPPARAEHSLRPPHTDTHSGHTHRHTLTGLRRVGTLRVCESKCAREERACLRDRCHRSNEDFPRGLRWGPTRGLSLSPRVPLLSQTASHLAFGESHQSLARAIRRHRRNDVARSRRHHESDDNREIGPGRADTVA